MTVTERLRSALPGRTRQRSAVESLTAQVEALRRFLDSATGYLPEQSTAPAEAVIERAGQRLALTGEHTVVALAGATGSGKSSIFNALAGRGLSAVGVRRPTTGAAHACAWGPAARLLDWLDVPPARRFAPAGSALPATATATGDADPPAAVDPLTGDAADPAAGDLDGLVLLDLPDFDSVEPAHRIEVDRLLGVVDLIVWVLDPQKYADRVVHQRYLRQFSRHREITVVLLHQADRLSAEDTERCLDDLGALVTADGLAGVPVLATSITGAPGLAPLRTVLAQAVAERRAAVQRLAGDVARVVDELRPLVEPAIPDGDPVEPAASRALTEALANAAGVPVVARATERAYLHRAVRSTGWPPLRWVRRLRPDPLSRLRLGPGRAGQSALTSDDQPTPGATSVPPAAPAVRAAVGLALRTLSEQAAERLPTPWPAAMLTAARARADDLPDALDLAIAGADLGLTRRPRWWGAVGAVQWLLAAMAVLGLAWLGVRSALVALALPEPPDVYIGRVLAPTFLFLGGLAAGWLLAVLIRPVVRFAAQRKGRLAARRMREAIGPVADSMVIGPVREVRRAYQNARDALHAAAP